MSEIGSLKGEALHQAVEVAVLRKGLDAAEMEGEAAVKLIDQSGEVAASPPAKIRPGGHPDLGNLIDTYI